jgi:hypothetical protein
MQSEWSPFTEYSNTDSQATYAPAGPPERHKGTSLKRILLAPIIALQNIVIILAMVYMGVMSQIFIRPTAK